MFIKVEIKSSITVRSVSRELFVSSSYLRIFLESIIRERCIFFRQKNFCWREKTIYIYLMYFSFIFFMYFLNAFIFLCLFLIQVYSYKSILLYIRGLFLLYLCRLYYIVKLYIISFNEPIMSGTSRCKCPCSWKQSLRPFPWRVAKYTSK